MDLIVADQKGIEVECLDCGYKREDMMSRKRTLQFSDTLTIENQRKYIVGVGWFVEITVNNRVKEYICVADLEKHIIANKALSPVDCMLEYFNVSYQLDKALETRDKTKFLNLSQKKREISSLYDKITRRIPA